MPYDDGPADLRAFILLTMTNFSWLTGAQMNKARHWVAGDIIPVAAKVRFNFFIPKRIRIQKKKGA